LVSRPENLVWFGVAQGIACKAISLELMAQEKGSRNREQSFWREERVELYPLCIVTIHDKDGILE